MSLSLLTAAENMLEPLSVVQHSEKYRSGINRINMWREWPHTNVYVLMLRIEGLMWHECGGHTIVCVWGPAGASQGHLCRTVFGWYSACVFPILTAGKVGRPYLDLSVVADMQKIAFQCCRDWEQLTSDVGFLGLMSFTAIILWGQTGPQTPEVTLPGHFIRSTCSITR